MKKILMIMVFIFVLAPLITSIGDKIGSNLNSDSFIESRKQAKEESIQRKNDEEEKTRNEELEKQVHETSFNLFYKYQEELFDKYEEPTVEQLDEVEQRSISETAVKFNLSEDKVIEIFTRLEAQKYK